METRLDVEKIAPPEAAKPLLMLEHYVRNSGLESSLLNLIKLRASQINGCAYCIDMHSKDAKAEGETEQRLYELDAWRETPFYTPREEAALAWTEAVTLVAQDRVPRDVYDQALTQFTELELINLTLAVIAINSWNRLCISFRRKPGDYEPVEITGKNKEASPMSAHVR